MIEPQVDEVEAITGIDIKVVTADAGYAYAKAYGALERRGIDALIPAKAEPIKSRVPLRRFRYDAKNDILKCPRGRILRPARPSRAGRKSSTPIRARSSPDRLLPACWATLRSRSLSEVAQRLTMMFGPDALALAAACGGAADQPIDPGRHNHRSRMAPRCGAGIS